MLETWAACWKHRRQTTQASSACANSPGCLQIVGIGAATLGAAEPAEGRGGVMAAAEELSDDGQPARVNCRCRGLVVNGGKPLVPKTKARPFSPPSGRAAMKSRSRACTRWL